MDAIAAPVANKPTPLIIYIHIFGEFHMASLNQVTLMGRLGADPEDRNAGGTNVVSLRLATSERYKDKSGEQQEKTEWHQITIWNENLGTVATNYLKKGSQVMVQGSIQSRKYQSNDGTERTAYEIVLSRYSGQLLLIDKAEGNGGGSNRSSAGRSSYGEDAPF